MRIAGGGEVVRRLILTLLLSQAMLALAAQPGPIEVVGLFKDAAVLLVDEQHVLLRVGERSEQGIFLVSANSEQAVIEIDGKRQTLSLSRRMGGNFKAAEKSSVAVARNGAGQYVIGGAINGLPVRFLVDTGATVVAMSVAHARRLGLDYERGRKSNALTANGLTASYQVMLDSVQVGEISVPNVEAAVLEGGKIEDVLLGMSFLSRVQMAESNGLLLLESKL